jgi:hypothetical protein
MAIFLYPVWRWLATMATVVWGIGIEPKCLTDRTQMCFTIIPLQGAQGDRQVARQPKGRRAKVLRQRGKDL